MGTGRGTPERAGLADALFPRTRQRVLALLFGQPDRSFFLREVIERAASGSGSVQRELKSLSASGLVTVRSIGNQRHYQANRASPIFEELRAIVTKTVGVAGPLRAALRPIGKGIQLALIYGSIAAGEARAESDIDLLVVADDLTLEELHRRLASAERALGRRIEPTLYTAREFDKRRSTDNPFVKKVLSGSHILIIGRIDAESGPR